MAKYFSQFPLTYYTLSDDNSLDIVTNITSRFIIESNIKDNIVLYQKYYIQDSDTPDIIAAKLYDDPEKHWIVLMINDIVDVESEWPLSYENLMKYVDEKYMPVNGNEYDGIIWAKANTYAYYRKESTIYDGITTTNKFEIDANTYADLVESINDEILLADNNTITYNITKETKSYYDYEIDANEAKRNIKLLRPEYAKNLEKQLRDVFEERR
uniref:Baseplate wedge subunit n=1 Tax=viral metagenome TaxID=1070528 RepID=A0A6C0JSP6_9ZZZZ